MLAHLLTPVLALTPPVDVEVDATESTIDVRGYNADGDETDSLYVWRDRAGFHFELSFDDGSYLHAIISEPDLFEVAEFYDAEGDLMTRTEAMLDYLSERDPVEAPKWWKCAGRGLVAVGACTLAGPFACGVSATRAACGCLEYVGEKPPKLICEAVAA